MFSLLCLWSTTLQGQSGFVRNQFSFSTPQELELDMSRILVYVDSNNELDIYDIKDLSLNSFIEGEMINRLDEKRTYWLYYILENRSAENISHLIRGGANAKETYFISFDEKATFTEKKTGYHISANQRDIHQGNTTKIKLDHPSSIKAHVFVKIQSTDGMPIELKVDIHHFEK